MRRKALLATVPLAAALLVGGSGMAAAEPQKNQIRISATCDNGEQYTFVINGEGNAGHILGSRSNIIPVRSEVTYTYTDPETGEQVTTPPMSRGFGQGNKKGLRGNLINCTGQTTFVDRYLGPVVADFKFQAFVTPRGKG